MRVLPGRQYSAARSGAGVRTPRTRLRAAGIGLGLLLPILAPVPLGAACSDQHSDERAAERAQKRAERESRRDEDETTTQGALVVTPQQPETTGEGTDLEILELGEGSERFWVAFEDDKISIWANRMPADKLLKELEAYRGPTYTCFEPLTRPVTLSLVGVRMEDVLRKMLDGYNFAYYYEAGRLAHVRILNYVPGRSYKASDPIIPRIEWTRELRGEPKS